MLGRSENCSKYQYTHVAASTRSRSSLGQNETQSPGSGSATAVCHSDRLFGQFVMLTNVADKVGHWFIWELFKCRYMKEGVVLSSKRNSGGCLLGV